MNSKCQFYVTWNFLLKLDTCVVFVVVAVVVFVVVAVVVFVVVGVVKRLYQVRRITWTVSTQILFNVISVMHLDIYRFTTVGSQYTLSLDYVLQQIHM